MIYHKFASYRDMSIDILVLGSDNYNEENEHEARIKYNL
jgi:hypothetical protein